MDSLRDRVYDAIPAGVRPLLPGLGLVLAPLAFVLGIVWNALFLGRVDSPFTTVKLVVLVGLLGVMLVLERRIADRRLGWAWLEERGGAIATFGVLACVGSLYNAYIVLYVKSAATLKMFVFGLLLVAVLALTKFLRAQTAGEHARLAVFLLCTFSLLLFLIPVATGWFSGAVFFLSAIGALASTVVVYLATLVSLGGVVRRFRAGERPDAPGVVHAVERRDVFLHLGVWAGLLGVLFVLHLLAWIPPVPLAVLHAGVYRGVERTEEGYRLDYERPPFFSVGPGQDAPFRYREGDTVYFFTALFAPNGMALDVVHRWERYDETEGWQARDTIGFSVVGGRDNGFRGFTKKRKVEPGLWRVIVATKAGRAIGERRFRIIAAEGTPEVESRIYD